MSQQNGKSENWARKKRLIESTISEKGMAEGSVFVSEFF